MNHKEESTEPKEANKCPAGGYCYDRGCGIDHTNCLKLKEDNKFGYPSNEPIESNLQKKSTEGTDNLPFKSKSSPNQVDCPRCNGTGCITGVWHPDAVLCKNCEGTGYVYTEGTEKPEDLSGWKDNAKEILRRIGYDNDSITNTDQWIAYEVAKLFKPELASLRTQNKIQQQAIEGRNQGLQILRERNIKLEAQNKELKEENELLKRLANTK